MDEPLPSLGEELAQLVALATRYGRIQALQETVEVLTEMRDRLANLIEQEDRPRAKPRPKLKLVRR
jgi:hypothetical protein